MTTITRGPIHQRLFRTLSLAAVTCAALAGFPKVVPAAPVYTYSFEATLLEAPLDLLGAAASEGISLSSVSGTFSVDAAAPESPATAGDPALGSYPGAVPSLSIEIDSATASGAGLDVSLIDDGTDPLPPGDAFHFSGGVTGIDLADHFSLSEIFLTLRDSAGAAYASDGPPAPLPDLAQFFDDADDLHRISLGFADLFSDPDPFDFSFGLTVVYAIYTIDTLVLVDAAGGPDGAVPAPAPAWLVLSGLAGLLAARRVRTARVPPRRKA